MSAPRPLEAPRLGPAILRAAAAIVVVTALAAGAWLGYDAIVSHPVRQVVFAGATERLPAADLDALARSLKSAQGRTSLESVRDAARHVPWVRDASVRRLSLDTIEVRFETHEVLARWNEDALVSTRGEVFVADYDGALPRFRGGDGTAATIAREYATLVPAFRPLASPIAELRLSARGAWQATLESGLVLELGRSDVEARIARLAAAWPELAARGVSPAHADLRYANGFALKKRT